MSLLLHPNGLVMMAPLAHSVDSCFGLNTTIYSSHLLVEPRVMRS